MRGSSPTGISATTAKVIALTSVIELLSGLTATTSLPSGDTATAAAAIGRLRGMAGEGRTAEADGSGEISAMAAGSRTGVEASTAIAPDVDWICASGGVCAAQPTSRSMAGSVNAMRAVFECLLRSIFHLIKQR